MSRRMSHQQYLPVESFPAHFAAGQHGGAAFVRFRGAAFVAGRHVFPQVSPPTELLAAEAARQDELLAVVLHVALQRGHVAEGAGALFAFERLLRSVYQQVRHQVALLPEHFAALWALVRLLSGVDTEVQLLRPDGGERLPADGALLGVPLVSLQVSRKAVGGVRELAAEAAASVRVAATDPQGVLQQEAFPGTKAPTDVAAKALRRRSALSFFHSV